MKYNRNIEDYIIGWISDMEKKELLNWIENPLVYGKNVLPPHSDHMMLGEHGLPVRKLSLNGTWTFKYYRTPEEVDFGLLLNKNSQLLDQRIEVPGHLQMQGYGKPHYVNTQYPWDGYEDMTPPKVSKNSNPTGVCGTQFDLPEEFEGKRIRINFEGVESCFFLWVNGEFIGYHEDSFTPAEFDITSQVRKKDNYVCVMVVHFCSGSWMEDQDFFRFSGIFRDVDVYGIEKIHIEDIEVVTDLEKEFEKGTVNLNLRFDNALDEKTSWFEIRSMIKLKQTKEVISQKSTEQFMTSQDLVSMDFEIQDPRLWSAEAPNLYECEVNVYDARGRWVTGALTEFGFRRFEIIDKVMHLNGKRIIFRGVNRHEFHGLTGRVITEKEIEQDIITMKKNNINAVRTSHYPNQKAFYRLCDRYGLYVIDETNLETHGTWQKIGSVVSTDDKTLVPGDNLVWQPAVLARGKAMVERDKNHPSVLIWSCGNESFGGIVIKNLSEWFHTRDQSRLVHYEGVFRDRRYDETSDMESRMYAKPEEVKAYLEAEPEKPFILCEYAHAMGNSCGGVDRYTKLEDEYPLYQGGFIWDFSDQALLKESVNGKTYYAAGGEFDDRPTDGYFSGNGLCFADHTPTPKMEEIKYLYQPITMEFHDEEICVRNKNMFVTTEEYEFAWKLCEDGICKKEGSFQIAVEPLTQMNYPIPFEKEILEDMEGEVLFHCEARLKEDTLWAKKGFEVGFGQKILRESKKKAKDTQLAELVECDFNIGIKMRDSFAMVSKVDGRLISIRKDGEEYLNSPLRPDFWRAPTDNDLGNDNTFRWAQWKLASLYQKFTEVKVDAQEAVITTKFELATKPVSACYVKYKCYYENKIEVTVELQAEESELPCFGLVCRLKEEFQNLKWYGNCQKEAYADRKNGCRLGIMEDQVKNQYVPYLNPQENGNKTDVRFFTVKTNKGNGITVSSEKAFEASALPYTSHEMENAANISCLPESQYTVLGVYSKKSGVAGDDSWGAPIQESCIVHTKEHSEFTVCMEIF